MLGSAGLSVVPVLEYRNLNPKLVLRGGGTSHRCAENRGPHVRHRRAKLDDD